MGPTAGSSFIGPSHCPSTCLGCFPSPDVLPYPVVNPREAAPSMPAKRLFQLVLIKPSHYDDDGYVIRWWRAMIPSNSLAAMYGIAADCVERQLLGPDVDIAIDVIDETNTRINVPTLLARFRRHGNYGLVALVGVQSNQYPRALDIAHPFKAAGICVAMGGFHVSGCLQCWMGARSI